MNAPLNRHRFSFLVQSLDNSSPDIAVLNGVLLKNYNERSPEIIKLFDETTFISSRGKERAHPGGKCRSFVYNDRVLFEIHSMDADVSGRQSPIMCVGPFIGAGASTHDKEQWISTLLAEVQEFAEDGNRRISARQVNDLGKLAQELLRPATMLESSLATARAGCAAVQNTVETYLLGRNDYAVLPELPSKRRIILVLSNSDRQRFRVSPELRALATEPDVAIVSEPSSARNLPDLDRYLYDRDMLQNGSILIQNPYDINDYFLLGESEAQAVRAKVHAFLRLCTLLGATDVKVTAVEHIGAAFRTERELAGGRGSKGLKAATYSVDDQAMRQLMRDFSYRQVNHAVKRDALEAKQFAMDKRILWDRDLNYFLDAAGGERSHVDRLTVMINTREASESVRSRVFRVKTRAASFGSFRERSTHTAVEAIFSCEVIFGHR